MDSANKIHVWHCDTNLLEHMQFTINAVDNGEPVDMIYLDFKKALKCHTRDYF